MSNLLNGPLWSIALTFLFFYIGMALQKKAKTPLVNGYFISVTAIIVFLLLGGISFESYNVGGKYLTFVMGPATVALAIPLYRQIEEIKKYGKVILIATLVGAVSGVLTTMGIAFLLGADEVVIRSLAPKSVTNPIAVGVAENAGGLPSLAAAAVVATGILGALIGPEVLKLFKVEDKMAKGLAIGSSSHVLGTTRAFQEGEVEGAFSGMSIVLTGLFTAILVPVIIKIFFN